MIGLPASSAFRQEAVEHVIIHHDCAEALRDGGADDVRRCLALRDGGALKGR
jgi:hypothetical protein